MKNPSQSGEEIVKENGVLTEGEYKDKSTELSSSVSDLFFAHKPIFDKYTDLEISRDDALVDTSITLDSAINLKTELNSLNPPEKYKNLHYYYGKRLEFFIKYLEAEKIYYETGNLAYVDIMVESLNEMTRYTDDATFEIYTLK